MTASGMHWVGTWATAPAPAEGGAFSNQTLRMNARISIGGALLIDPVRADELLHEADVAMYIAKSGHLRHHISVLGFPVSTP